MKKYNLNELLSFLDSAPTAWHAVDVAVSRLQKSGFTELNEADPWKLEKGGRYYITRDGSSLCAFVNSIQSPLRTRLLASHLDSPAFKLKPKPEIRKQNMVLFGVEVYGGPLLSSWLNRDLGIAGRICTEDAKGKIRTSLVNLTQNPVVIPQLAIHLDRDVNEKGLILNKQEHLNALAALSDTLPSGSYLELILKQQLNFKELLGFDLFLYPLEKARYVGYDQQIVSSYRIDSLASVHAALEALISNPEPIRDEIKMAVFWNHEEVGSLSSQGASSPFASQILERVLLSHKQEREGYLRHLSKSICVSIDLAHAWHPNYSDKHDPQHQPLLGKGVVVKNNAQQRYATDARSALPIRLAAKHCKQTLQEFVSRNDIPSGTTIGPIHTGATGMATVDIGCGQLSMHSCRELMSCEDQKALYSLLSAYLDTKKF